MSGGEPSLTAFLGINLGRSSSVADIAALSMLRTYLQSQCEKLEYLHAELVAEIGEAAHLRLVSYQRLGELLLRLPVDKLAKVQCPRFPRSAAIIAVWVCGSGVSLFEVASL